MSARGDFAEFAAEVRRELEAEIAETERQLAAARARYDAATQIVLQALANGAQLPPGVDATKIGSGPFPHPDGYEAGEREFWGRPPKGTRLS